MQLTRGQLQAVVVATVVVALVFHAGYKPVYEGPAGWESDAASMSGVSGANEDGKASTRPAFTAEPLADPNKTGGNSSGQAAEEKAKQEKAEEARKAEAEKAEQEKAEKAEQKEKAEQEEAEKAEKAEKAEQEKAEKEKAEKEKADKVQAEKEKAAKETAEQEKVAQERAERERADKEKAEEEKAERERADKEKAEQEKLAQEKAEKEKADKEKAAKERADKEKVEQEKAAKEKAEQEKVAQEKADKEKADKEKAEEEKAEKERADKEKAEQEKAEKERADKEKAEQEKAGREHTSSGDISKAGGEGTTETSGTGTRSEEATQSTADSVQALASPGGVPLVLGRVVTLAITMKAPIKSTVRAVVDRNSPQLLEVLGKDACDTQACRITFGVREDWRKHKPEHAKLGYWVVLAVVDVDDNVLARQSVFVWEVAFGPTFRMIGRKQEKPMDLKVWVKPYQNYKFYYFQLEPMTYYNVILVDNAKDADLVWASVHDMEIGPECLKYDPPPILLMWSGENTPWNDIRRPGNNVGWGHQHNENVIVPRGDMTFYARYPYYFRQFFDPLTCFFEWRHLKYLLDYDDAEARWLERPNLAAFIARHGGYPREEVVTYLDDEFGKDSVHRPSKSMHNVPNFDGTIHEYLRDFKFSIQLENAPGDGYITEKVFNALSGAAVPIWWGGNGTRWQEKDVINDGRLVTFSTQEKLYRDMHLLLENDTYRANFFKRRIVTEGAHETTANMCYYAWDGVMKLLDDRLLGKG